MPFAAFKIFQRGGQRTGRRLVKENAGFSFADRFQCAAGAESNHGPPGGINFQRRQAEIFFSRKEQGAAAGGITVHHFIGLAA